MMIHVICKSEFLGELWVRHELVVHGLCMGCEWVLGNIAPWIVILHDGLREAAVTWNMCLYEVSNGSSDISMSHYLQNFPFTCSPHSARQDQAYLFSTFVNTANNNISYYSSTKAPTSNIDATKIFVSCLSCQTIRELPLRQFEQYGKESSVDMVWDQNRGDPRSFAFVVFKSDDPVDFEFRAKGDQWKILMLSLLSFLSCHLYFIFIFSPSLLFLQVTMEIKWQPWNHMYSNAWFLLFTIYPNVSIIFSNDSSVVCVESLLPAKSLHAVYIWAWWLLWGIDF